MYKLIRKNIQLVQNNPCRHNWILSVTAEAESEDADPNIFVYHAGDQQDTSTGLVHGDTFNNVASLQDMDVLPVGAPEEVEDATMQKDEFIPFYRLNTVELNCYNVDEANKKWRIIQAHVHMLVKEYEAWDKLKTVEEVII